MRGMSLKAAVVAATVIGGATTASALTVDLDYIPGTYAMEGRINVKDPIDNTPQYSGSAGAFHMRDTTGPLGDFVAWCLDLSTYLRSGETYNVLNKSDTLFTNGFGAVLLSDMQKGHIQSLFDTAYDTVSNNLDKKKFSGGFQLALWEIVYEESADDYTDYSLGTGRFVDTFVRNNGNRTGAFKYANQLLAGLGADDVSVDSYNLLFLESELKDNKHPRYGHTSQNLVTATPVPLPATGLLLLGGIAGFVGLRRRKS